MSEASAGSGAWRWLILVVAMGLAGWSAFTLYERMGGSALFGAPTAPKDERLEGFVAAGQKALEVGDLEVASEQLIKASGLNEADPRVQEGLVLVEVVRAERIWWDLALGDHEPKAFSALVDKLDAQVDRAREAIAEARRKAIDPMLAVHLLHYEHTLNTMVVVALTRAGQADRAKGALAARLASHPQRQLFEAFVGRVSEPADAPPADAGVEAEGDAGAAPAVSASASAPASASPGSSPMWPGQRRDYEFEHEPPPTKGVTVPGELELPATH